MVERSIKGLGFTQTPPSIPRRENGRGEVSRCTIASQTPSERSRRLNLYLTRQVDLSQRDSRAVLASERETANLWMLRAPSASHLSSRSARRRWSISSLLVSFSPITLFAH